MAKRRTPRRRNPVSAGEHPDMFAPSGLKTRVGSQDWRQASFATITQSVGDLTREEMEELYALCELWQEGDIDSDGLRAEGISEEFIQDAESSDTAVGELLEVLQALRDESIDELVEYFRGLISDEVDPDDYYEYVDSYDVQQEALKQAAELGYELTQSQVSDLLGGRSWITMTSESSNAFWSYAVGAQSDELSHTVFFGHLFGGQIRPGGPFLSWAERAAQQLAQPGVVSWIGRIFLKMPTEDVEIACDRLVDGDPSVNVDCPALKKWQGPPTVVDPFADPKGFVSGAATPTLWKDVRVEKDLSDVWVYAEFDEDTWAEQLQETLGEPGATSEDEEHQAPDTEAFKKWFGESVVRKEDGTPQVCFHGTKRGGFSVFSKSKIDAHHAGFFFSDKLRISRTYTTSSNEVVPPLVMPSSISAQYKKSGIYRVYLRIQNPLVIDAKDNQWNNIPWTDPEPRDDYEAQKRYWKTDKLAHVAKDRGFDGLIVKNVRDSGGETGADPMGTVYVVFNPNQIKSATVNTGEYSLEDEDIRHNPGLALKDIALKALNARRPDWHMGGDMGDPEGFLVDCGGQLYAMRLELWSDDCLMDLARRTPAAARKRGEALAKRWTKAHWPQTGYKDLRGAEGFYGATWAIAEATPDEQAAASEDNTLVL
jgi:hypothetical protein